MDFKKNRINCFADAIIEDGVEVCQYVGDEIILSWPSAGEGANPAAIACFFAMKEKLRQKEVWFREHFGVVPTFKAGIHFGPVTTGEENLYTLFPRHGAPKNKNYQPGHASVLG